jgi:predicted ABC-type ATPase
VERAGATETITRFTRDDGTWLPERQQEHDRIEQKFLAGMRPVRNPTVRMLGGGPASGKSVMLKEVPDNWAHVDPDEVKTALPEWDTAVAAGDTGISAKVHEESSYLAKKIVNDALDSRYNVIVDGTGDGSYENLAKKVASYRKSGARVVAEYVTVDVETAIQRAASRGARTGRFVPETVIREIHRGVSNVFPQAVENGLFDEFVLWDNNGPTAIKIAEGTGNRLRILNAAAWQRFLAKATG